MSRHAALVDLLSDSFERCGASTVVLDLEDTGYKLPDLLVGYAGVSELVRVLSPWEEYEADFDSSWNGHVTFVRSTSDVLPLLEKMAQRNWSKK